ncbi:MAG TPA: hypothetical protein VNZ53_49390, partial [Steroidobacteraceae bacterium]|nr:hypothetical protein [Steroidobacteraceae bacterium]
WSGTERISRMKEWPDWLPPKEMITRQPYLPRFMAGGETNPLGARAMYSCLLREEATHRRSSHIAPYQEAKTADTNLRYRRSNM